LKYSEYKDIYDFYQKTGMTREEAYEFLKKELKGEKENDRRRMYKKESS